MQLLPDSTGPYRNGEVCLESGDFREDTKVSLNSTIISKANSVPLITLFKDYNVHLQFNKSICPFKFHKNGQERSPSFIFYPTTNSFYCWGCQKGGSSCNFVANMEEISVIDSAYKIINLYEDLIQEDVDIYQQDNEKILFSLVDFSNFIRELNKNKIISLNDSEKYTFVFDKLNKKHKLNLAALEAVVVKIKRQIEIYVKNFNYR